MFYLKKAVVLLSFFVANQSLQSMPPYFFEQCGNVRPVQIFSPSPINMTDYPPLEECSDNIESIHIPTHLASIISNALKENLTSMAAFAQSYRNTRAIAPNSITSITITPAIIDHLDELLISFFSKLTALSSIKVSTCTSEHQLKSIFDQGCIRKTLIHLDLSACRSLKLFMWGPLPHVTVLYMPYLLTPTIIPEMKEIIKESQAVQQQILSYIKKVAELPNLQHLYCVMIHDDSISPVVVYQISR
jgi:hypothetical protein